MSAIPATIPSIEQPDHLAGALLRSFSRQVGERTSWSFIKTLLWSSVTFGFGPLYSWPAGLRDLIHSERAQFLHLAEWMRLRSGHPHAVDLVAAAEQIRPNFALSRLPPIIALLVGIIFAFVLGNAGFPHRGLLDATYNYGWSWPSTLGASNTNELFLLWTAGLSIAYVLHGCQLLAHAANVRQTVHAFNRLATAEGLPPVPDPPSAHFRPIWFAAALLMMSASAVWAIPMMLAGGWQRRYVAVTGPNLRATVADRLRDLLLLRRPAMHLAKPVSLPRRCPNPICRAAIARIANFCPRCGTHVGPEIDELA